MKTLREIVDTEVAVNKEAAAYWDANIQPRIDACSDAQQFDKIRSDVSLACSDAELQIRSMPADFEVRFILASQRFRTKS